jgi:hypothetical protein
VDSPLGLAAILVGKNLSYLLEFLFLVAFLNVL